MFVVCRVGVVFVEFRTIFGEELKLKEIVRKI